MTISSTANKAIGYGNGVATNWPHKFLIPNASQLTVILTDPSGNQTTLSPSQYAVSGIGNRNGGTVTYPLSGAPLPLGWSITRLRLLPIVQQTDIVNQSGFYPDVVESAMDYQTMTQQQLAEQQSRSIALPVVDDQTVINPVLPAAAARATKPLIFDAAGNVVTGQQAYQEPQTLLDNAKATAEQIAAGVAPGAGTGTFLQNGTGVVARTFQDKERDIVHAKDFAYVDPTGATDSTIGLQKWVDFCRVNNRRGRIGAGTFKLTGSLNIPASQNWGLSGEAYGGTQLIQYADNTPIFLFGSDNSSVASFNVDLQDLQFGYANAQDSTKSSGCPIYFNTMWFHVGLQRLVFNGGWYGIKVKPGAGGPWGCKWNDLIFGGALQGGAMDWTGAVNGVPNNEWGRMTFNCGNMVGPVLNNIRGYNFKIGCLEFLSANLGPQLFSLAAGAAAEIDAMKLEVGTYTGNQSLFAFLNAARVKIGTFALVGNPTVIAPAAGTSLVLFGTGAGGATGSLDIDLLVAGASTFSGNVYLVSGSGGPMRIKRIQLDGNPWQLSNAGSTVTPETLSVDDWNNGLVSQNKGDADYTVTLGDPNTVSFETAFTAPRNITLPGVLNNLFNGLRYRLRFKGAINGANTAVIKSGDGATLTTLTSDSVMVEFTWRRASAAYKGWVMTAYNTLP
ncbi:hypothetical protein [Burkholderia vietnamiensis]|uniref:hypothetical protein n=1 Tax=Burkholderia vietnamiensis TaxID=60552 RepID=UPI002DD44A37|nr:hypothetical protein [Burkholderia vietnamiensis]MEC4595452.1 hypothetical protein [Burkholderia vietnamiensis]